MKNKYIKLYHYTNKPDIEKISPSFFGNNSYTGVSNRISSFKRTYFYDKPDPETLLKNSRYCYTAKIKYNEVYNIIEDKLSLNNSQYTFTEILWKLKKLKYKGIFGNVNNQYNVICLFYDIKAELIKK